MIIVSHFTLLSIHALYPNKYSFYYTYPFFQQNWNLFVPAPSENFDLYCIYTKKDVEVKRNLLREILEAHKANCFSGNEFLLSGLLNSIHYYKYQQSEKNLKVLRFFTLKTLESLENDSISNLKLILVVSPVDSRATEVYHTFSN